MKSPGRKVDSSSRHPANWSARHCSEPLASIRLKTRPIDDSCRMSAWAYSTLFNPNSRVFLLAYHGLVKLRSTASTCAPTYLRAVSIECWPVPQPLPEFQLCFSSQHCGEAPGEIGVAGTLQLSRVCRR